MQQRLSGAVLCGKSVLDHAYPPWRNRVAHRTLTIEAGNEHHLLAQVFGSFADGANFIQERYGVSLVELGFLPEGDEGTEEYRASALVRLREWYALVTDPAFA